MTPINPYTNAPAYADPSNPQKVKDEWKYADKWVYPFKNYPIYCHVIDNEAAPGATAEEIEYFKKPTIPTDRHRMCLFFCQKGECAADVAPGWVVGLIKFKHLQEIGIATGRDSTVRCFKKFFNY